jgi:hypothetical protein
MPKGKAKRRFNFNKDMKSGKEVGCEFENGTWCKLPKGERCRDVIRLKDGNKACQVTALDTHADF